MSTQKAKSKKWKKRILGILLFLLISVIGYGFYLFIHETSNIQTFSIDDQDQIMDNIYYFIPAEDSIYHVAKQLKQELELQEDGTSEGSIY
ncbi:hypothetical protein [Gracilibacillus suaedae]|uniref:hypothetical protein n=1 Tax=Gracilibacillus suaedae TaxID=2820273 RepID=UPI001ABDB148|nr:hypothetical protein [Gracilibacillus suaedae]